MLENWSNATITNIILAMYVAPGTGAILHKNRPSHGFAINDSNAVKKIFFSDGTVLNWRPNELCYLPKHSNYKVVTQNTGGCWAINFDLLEEYDEKPFKMSFRESGSVLGNFKKATQVWIEKPEFYNAIIKKHLYDIMIRIQKEARRNYIPSKKEKLILPAIEFIRRNYTKNDLTVQDLASLCGISEPYLRRLFTDKFSMSPKDYIIHLRIEHAKNLLSSKQFSVSEVAELCGYAEPCHFSREFSKHVSCSPNAYKRFE